MKFIAMIVGGVGPDVWDRDLEIDGADFADAANMAHGKAEEEGGRVYLLEEADHDLQPITKRDHHISELETLLGKIFEELKECNQNPFVLGDLIDRGKQLLSKKPL